MMSRQRGHLPMLQSIGRTTCVDIEEPPELSESEIDDPFVAQSVVQREPYYFEPDHADAAAAGLGKIFKVLNPGNNICKKPPPNTANFIHCGSSVLFARKYSHLRELLEARSRLQLVRDYTSRLNAAAMFVDDLERITMCECQTWHDICHDTLTGVPETNLECLSSICEDLRVHMSHWNSIKQLVHMDCWLRPLLPRLLLEMDIVRQRLYDLRDKAIWWIEQLIQVGLKVLAHSDLDRQTEDSLWGITRGLEDFNNVVMLIKSESSHNHSLRWAQQGEWWNPTTSRNVLKYSTRQMALDMNSYRYLGETVKPIAFGQVLKLLAGERAKYAAASTHHFFTGSNELLRLVLKNKLPEYSWGKVYSNCEQSLRSLADTSDYHSASSSHTSNKISVLRVGNLILPDLSQKVSPLVDFARKEYDFAQHFLQIVCASTMLLNKSPRLPHCTPSQRGQRNTEHVPNFVNSPDLVAHRGSGRKVKGFSSRSKNQHEQHFDLKDSTRKSVSWGDAGKFTQIRQLTLAYMDLLWQYFGDYLTEFFQRPVWGGPEAAQGQLGTIHLWPDVISMIVIKIINQTCVTDLFPPASVPMICVTAKRLEVMAVWSAWDTSFCKAVAMSIGDKCQPTMLADGDFSTRTAKQLRDTCHPLHSLLASLDFSEEKGSPAKMSSQPLAHSILLATLQRLIATCEVSHSWCSTKSHSLLTQRALSSFLLVTQSDLKLLVDEMQKSLSLCHDISNIHHHGNNTEEQNLHQQLEHLWHHLSNVTAHMQTLSGSVMKQFSENCTNQSLEYFEEAMPIGKLWRKKSLQEIPTEPQEYIILGVDDILEPVVSGVCKLRTTSQLSCVSVAVTAMCKAWADYILQQKIRFSMYGAYQLQADVSYVQRWLHEHIEPADVRQSALALDVFKYFCTAVDLLKRQPRARSRSRSRNATQNNNEQHLKQAKMDNWHNVHSLSPTPTSSNETSSEPESTFSSASLRDGRANGTVADHDTHASGGATACYRMPHMEQWLSLRVHGGARNWPKLPSCFHSNQP